MEAEGDCDLDSEADAEAEAEGLTEGETLEEAEALDDGDSEAEGERLAEAEEAGAPGKLSELLKNGLRNALNDTLYPYLFNPGLKIAGLKPLLAWKFSNSVTITRLPPPFAPTALVPPPPGPAPPTLPLLPDTPAAPPS